jgi:hypothetical protein
MWQCQIGGRPKRCLRASQIVTSPAFCRCFNFAVDPHALFKTGIYGLRRRVRPLTISHVENFASKRHAQLKLEIQTPLPT